MDGGRRDSEEALKVGLGRRLFVEQGVRVDEPGDISVGMNQPSKTSFRSLTRTSLVFAFPSGRLMLITTAGLV